MHKPWFRRLLIMICPLWAAVLMGSISTILKGTHAQGEIVDSDGYVQETPTPTFCPAATPEALWVEPVTSPTNLFSQTIVVDYTNSEAITITCESGNYALHDDSPQWDRPVELDIELITDTTHHLTVYSKIAEVYQWGCRYGGYTLQTSKDRHAGELVIEQIDTLYLYKTYLPVFIRNIVNQE